MNERQKKAVISDVTQKVTNDKVEVDKYTQKYFSVRDMTVLKCVDDQRGKS